MIDSRGTLGSPSTQRSMTSSGICFFEPLKVPRPGRPQVKSVPLGTVHLCKLQGSHFFIERLHSASLSSILAGLQRNLFQRPNVIRETSGHSGSDSQRLVNASKIVVHVKTDQLALFGDFAVHPKACKMFHVEHFVIRSPCVWSSGQCLPSSTLT